MSTARVQTAIVGTGFIAPAHLEALRRLGRSLAGILGSTPERGRAAAQRLGLPRHYENWEELLADPHVRVVHLCSPNRLHFESCRRVLQAGKHVVCEKPLAMTAEETRQLLGLAEQAGNPGSNARPLVCAVCYNVRYYPLCWEARHRLREQDEQGEQPNLPQTPNSSLGRIYHVSGAYLQDWLLYETDFNWRVLAEEGGALRALADIGTHWLDLVTWITGLQVQAVCADLVTVHPTRRRPTNSGSVETFQGQLGKKDPRRSETIAVFTEDHGSVLLRFHGGATGCFIVSQVAAGRKNCLRFEIAAARGSLAWDSERPNELWLGSRATANSLLTRDPSLLSEPARQRTIYPGGHNEGYPDSFTGLFRDIYEAVDACERGEHGEHGERLEMSRLPFPTFLDGHREVVLCEAILQSHHERRWVEVS